MADQGSKREFEDMIGFYMERLGKWEYSIQASSGGLFEVNAKIQSLSKKRAELE